MKWLFAVCGGLLVLGHAATSLADVSPPIPSSSWDADARITLARAWVGEADWRPRDHIAIGWVLAKRWKIYNRRPERSASFGEFIRLYCSPLKGHSRRQRLIQALPWGDPTSMAVGAYKHPKNVTRWRRVRERVERWGRGLFRDPCPKALHWGGTMDTPYRNWFPVRCGGPTANIFYRIQRAPLDG